MSQCTMKPLMQSWNRPLGSHLVFCIASRPTCDTHVGVSAGVSSRCQRGGSAVSRPGLTRGHTETPPSLGLSFHPPVAAIKKSIPDAVMQQDCGFSPECFPFCFSKIKNAASDPGSRRLFGVKM